MTSTGYQDNRNIAVNFKRETTYGEKPSVITGAEVLRLNSGGLNLNKTPIQSAENRSDLMRTRGRQGAKLVNGEYEVDGSIKSFESLIEAVFRGAFTAALDISTLGLGDATVSSNVITFATGGLLGDDIKVGDALNFTAGLDSADLNKEIPIIGLTDTSITSGVDLTDSATPTTPTGSRFKKLIMGKQKYSYSFEEYEEDVDGTEMFKGCRVVGMSLELQPNNMLKITFRIIGQDMELLEAGNAPYYDSPTREVTLPLTAVEAGIIIGGTKVLDLTGLSIDLDLGGQGENVVGSTLTPDVFMNLFTLTSSFTALKKDLVNVKRFLNETAFDIHVRFAENETAPADVMGFYLPNVTMGTSTKSPVGTDGPRTQTYELLTGVDERGSANGYDLTMLKYFSTAT